MWGIYVTTVTSSQEINLNNSFCEISVTASLFSVIFFNNLIKILNFIYKIGVTVSVTVMVTFCQKGDALGFGGKYA